MGNRAGIVITDNNGRYSPTIYIHWGGDTETVKEMLKDAFASGCMRAGEVSYTCARIIGYIHEHIFAGDNLSLGVMENGWQAAGKPDIDRAADWNDNGVYIFNCESGRLEQYYSKDEKVWDEQIIAEQELIDAPNSLVLFNRGRRKE